MKIWDAVSGQLSRTFAGHTSRVMSVAFTPDGKRIVSGGLDRTIKIWDIASGQLLRTLTVLSREIRVVFPVHPRTRKRIEDLGTWTPSANIRFIDPVGYIEFLALQMHATLVITDSGGIQEETTYLGTPCLTVRKNTERPVTVTTGHVSLAFIREWTSATRSSPMAIALGCSVSDAQPPNPLVTV